jgi:hypothetical protein
VKALQHLPVFWILIVFSLAFSSDTIPLSQLYKTGQIRFEKEYILDDDAMPADVFFESPSTVTCDPGGNIYVVDAGAKNIKKFDRQGKFLKTIGREGQGPGEFGGLYHATFAKDRLTVWDSGNRRLCSFTPEGEFIHTASIPFDEGSVRKLRGLPTGEVLVEMEKTFRKEPDKPQTCTIDLYSSDLVRARTIYKRELWRKKYIRTKEYGISTLFFPYSADVRWEVTPDGRIVIGYSANYELEIYDRFGNKISTFSHTYEPAEVTAKDRKDYFDSLEFYRMGERLKEIPEYVTKYTEFPKHKPVYKKILVDEEGNIWVVLNREQQEEKGKVIDVFDPTGLFVSRVLIEGDTTFPDNRNAYILHNGFFLLIETGENDLYRIIRYRMTG